MAGNIIKYLIVFWLIFSFAHQNHHDLAAQQGTMDLLTKTTVSALATGALYVNRFLALR